MARREGVGIEFHRGQLLSYKKPTLFATLHNFQAKDNRYPQKQESRSMP